MKLNINSILTNHSYVGKFFAARVSNYKCSQLKCTYRVFIESKILCYVGENFSNTKKTTINLQPEQQYWYNSKLSIR